MNFPKLKKIALKLTIPRMQERADYKQLKKSLATAKRFVKKIMQIKLDCKEEITETTQDRMISSFKTLTGAANETKERNMKDYIEDRINKISS